MRAELLFSIELKKYFAISILAVLYLANTILYMIALRLTTPSFIHVAFLAKLPITGILHHLIIRPQRSIYAWLSLGFLSFGIILFHLPADILATIINNRPLSAEGIDLYSVVAVTLGILIAISSGLIGIYTELILKGKTPFWVTQTWLYAFGSTAAGVTLCFWSGESTFAATDASSPLPLDRRSLHILVAAAVTGTGLIVANILRTGDNLVKIVGASASIIAIVLTESFLYKSSILTTQTTAGIGIATISTWTYNFYRQTPRVDQETEASGERKTDVLIPTRTKLLFAGLTVALLTILTSLHQTAPHSLPLPSHHPSFSNYSKDIERFFVPHNLSPAIWAPGVNPPRCLFDYIEKHQIALNSPEVLNWERAYLDTGCLVFPIPDKGFVFHSYWRGPWREAFNFMIESFLATQRLEDGTV